MTYQFLDSIAETPKVAPPLAPKQDTMRSRHALLQLLHKGWLVTVRVGVLVDLGGARSSRHMLLVLGLWVGGSGSHGRMWVTQQKLNPEAYNESSDDSQTTRAEKGERK